MTVALITGANSGIGRGAAVDLAAKGWTVYGSMRSLDKGDKLAALAEEAGVAVHPVVCDVTDAASVDRAVAEVVADAGRIDVLVNNAGIGGNGVLEETAVDDYASVMDVNLYGIIRACQAVLPHMREQGSGCILNVSSIAGVIAALAQSPYVASKWAVEGLTHSWAMELGRHDIRVNCVAPGTIAGPRMQGVIDREAVAMGVEPADVKAAYEDQVSMRSFVEASDIAAMVTFLCSDAARLINGQIVAVDGYTETLRTAFPDDARVGHVDF